ncbi:Telomerase reverse transcriptase [Basidiobolus ranarum]|uniref:Telomerase reverse transcriptase n=1 Tax=Basidiobolus ranarum TaxID=34480 RepID=A0ABR2WRH3_9FUNG
MSNKELNSPPIRSFTITNLFTNIASLHDYFLKKDLKQRKILLDSDSNEYKEFLTKTLVVETKPVEVTLSQNDVLSTQGEIVNRVIQTIFQYSRGNPSNIMTLGYRRIRNHNTYGVSGLVSVENYFPNTIVNSLKSKNWETLLSRIGEKMMYRLLLDTLIFIPLPNDCFYQATGAPVSDLVLSSNSLKKSVYVPSKLFRRSIESVFCTKDVGSGVNASHGQTSESRNTSTKVHDISAKSSKRNDKSESTQPRKKCRRGKRKKTATQCNVEGRVSLTSPKEYQVISHSIPAMTERSSIENREANYDGNSSINGTTLSSSDVRIAQEDWRSVQSTIASSSGQKRKFVQEITEPFPVKYARTVSNISEKSNSSHRSSLEKTVKYPSTIVFERSRIFYSRPIRKHKIPIYFGLPYTHHINVAHFKDIMLMMFPKQFNLKSPFSSTQKPNLSKTLKIPWRLKKVVPLIKKLTQLHKRCNYHALLIKNCPLQQVDGVSISRLIPLTSRHEDKSASKASFSSYFQVSCFVHSIMNRVIPYEFWGSNRNRLVIYRAIDQFIRGRRYESMSLHQIIQSVKISDCEWLESDNIKHTHMPPSDMEKRKELFHEFVAYLFNSIVIPLLKTNFYITESSQHRNRVFYFRQDFWHMIAKPALSKLSSSIYTRISVDEAQNILLNRDIGYSYLRLLPKENGVRPIVNLRRKYIKNLSNTSQGKAKSRKKELGLSINTLLQNAFQILTFEKTRQPDIMGSSVLGMNDIYRKLMEFKTKISGKDMKSKFYFAKVDITGAFDSINQSKLISILKAIFKEEEYMLQKYTAIYPSAGKLRKRFIRKARPGDDFTQFPELAQDMASNMQHVVFIDQVAYGFEDIRTVLTLLEEHISKNLIKIDNKFYKQTGGIPQGSIVSTLLCSIFYGHFEKHNLSFIDIAEDGLLLRLVDDFLYISLDKKKVTQFLEVMHAGNAEYGCFINPQKTLTNFQAKINGENISHITNEDKNNAEFPWCGLLINTQTLDVKTDYNRYLGTYINNTLTVEVTNKPGVTFRHKLMQVLKPRFHPIFINPDFNQMSTILLNIYQSYLLCAMKFHRYSQGLRVFHQQKEQYLTDILYDIVQFGYVLLKSRSQSNLRKCKASLPNVTEPEVIWLGIYAFYTILSKRQTAYPKLIKSLKITLEDLKFRTIKRRLQATIEPRRSSAFANVLF